MKKGVAEAISTQRLRLGNRGTGENYLGPIKKGNPRRYQAATDRGFWGGGGLRASAIPYGLTED